MITIIVCAFIDDTENSVSSDCLYMWVKMEMIKLIFVTIHTFKNNDNNNDNKGSFYSE